MVTGRDALTPSERRIAALAGDGRSNREIAQTLFVTTKTVETHLRHVYRKLDISGRTQLATRAGGGHMTRRSSGRTVSFGAKWNAVRKPDVQGLEQIANRLVAEGKGILAADESNGTINKRLDAAGVEASEETRRALRELLFTTEGAADHISGVILYDETFRQGRQRTGHRFPRLLEEQGVVPGIKVDTGAKALAGSPDEKVTEGLDGLRAPQRVPRARRALREVARGHQDRRPQPDAVLLRVNAHALARYAALCQEARSSRSSSRRSSWTAGTGSSAAGVTGASSLPSSPS